MQNHLIIKIHEQANCRLKYNGEFIIIAAEKRHRTLAIQHFSARVVIVGCFFNLRQYGDIAINNIAKPLNNYNAGSEMQQSQVCCVSGPKVLEAYHYKSKQELDVAINNIVKPLNNYNPRVG